MGKALEGKRIVIAGSRKTDEMSILIEKQGGIPAVRSLQGTVFLADKQVEPDLKRFVDEGADWAIFTTGIGTETLLNLAEKMDIKESFLQIICEAKVASRGYKTYAALKKLDIKPVAVDEDGTTKGLVRALDGQNFSGKRVMVQLHGENAPTLVKFLEDNGASVMPLLPYQHIAPEREAVETLCQELLNNEVDAVCFTTAIQVRSLFDFAREQGYANEILQAFKGKALAAAVGKVTAEALEEEGVERLVVPENERMGAMVIELCKYYEQAMESK
ncbi:uroporphyrinogen-III synthase [Priestia abyssalis]|uniref:uroporphyrinogen-III synthase n=1 Tax=Priestia abyssalis TaxID=1221450 RepID=UPI0009952711|nr:uroporphyrinogen-III synthase [Priestia abyssalis]